MGLNSPAIPMEDVERQPAVNPDCPPPPPPPNGDQVLPAPPVATVLPQAAVVAPLPPPPPPQAAIQALRLPPPPPEVNVAASSSRPPAPPPPPQGQVGKWTCVLQNLNLKFFYRGKKEICYIPVSVLRLAHLRFFFQKLTT